MTDYTIQVTINGITYPIRRDVSYCHSIIVHEAFGIESESQLQHMLDQMNVSDWYDDFGQYMGQDVNGMEIFFTKVPNGKSI